MAINKKLFIKSAAGGVTPSEHFNVTLFNGNNTTVATTFNASSEGGLFWIANRQYANGNFLIDSVRGVTETFFGTDPSASVVRQSITAFNSSSVTVGTYTSIGSGGSGENVLWFWRGGGTAVTNTNGTTSSTISLNSDAGFSIVKTSAAGGTINVGHGLGADIGMIILKGADTAETWQIWHKDVGTGKYLQLASNAQVTTRANSFSTVNSTIFENNWTSGSVEWIAYCFTSITGFSKIGTYNGSSSEHTVDLGFAPAFVMIKRTDSSGGWRIFDYKRDSGTGDRRVDHSLQAQSGGAEYDNSGNPDEYLRFTDTGLKFPTNATNPDVNNSSGTYIYMAFARD